MEGSVSLPDQGVTMALVSFLASLFFVSVVVYAITTFAMPSGAGVRSDEDFFVGLEPRPEHLTGIISTNLLDGENLAAD